MRLTTKNHELKFSKVGKIRTSLISVNLTPHEYKLLSSAKLQVSDCSINMNTLLRSILNKTTYGKLKITSSSGIHKVTS